MVRFGFGNRKNPPPPESQRIAQLLDVIKRLSTWELVKIIWLDACIGRRKNPLRLQNRDFATYAEQVGYFLTCLTDHRYNEYHLIIALEKIDEVPDEELHVDIFSVPLPSVRRIVRLEEKKQQLKHKGVKIKRVAIPTIKLKLARVEKSRDGSVKIILNKRVKE